MNNPKIIMLVFIIVFGAISAITIFNSIDTKNNGRPSAAEIAENQVWDLIQKKVEDELLVGYSDYEFTENPVKLPDRGYSVIYSHVDVKTENDEAIRIFYAAHIQKAFGKWECHFVEEMTRSEVKE